jgi:hypothetical protein
MRLRFIQDLLDGLRGRGYKQFARSKVYGKIFSPIYNTGYRLDPSEPNIYNKDGLLLRTFFIRDVHWAHSPYHMQSRYFTWDRFNIGLKTHFYTHQAMVQQVGNPDVRYGLLWESESLVPEDYKIFDRRKGLEKDFDLIFTFSEALLEKLPNARFFPGCASSWYGTNFGGGKLSETSYLRKQKNVSILASNKTRVPLHKFRLALAKKLKHEGVADTFGTFSSGRSVMIAETLDDYRFSFAIENDIKPLFFTERLTSCFASMTIPIYLGASKIDHFFNPDGIIFLKTTDLDSIDNILKKCTEREYERRLPAVLDNFQRVQPYLNANDWLFKTYLRETL